MIDRRHELWRIEEHLLGKSKKKKQLKTYKQK